MTEPNQQHDPESLPPVDTEVIKKRYLRKRILEHMLGPFGSIILHIILIALAVRFLGMVTEDRTASIQVQIMEPDAIDLEEFERELQELQDLQDMTDLMNPQDALMDAPPDVSADVSTADDMSMDLADLNVLSDAKSPLVMRGLYEGRSGAGRSRMLGAAGRWGQETERAVIRALEWMKNNQEQDGSWRADTGGEQGMRMRVGITGLCLLAFLAHGETTSSERYGPVVEKAIRYLISRQTESGHFIDTDDPENAPYKAGTYGQAIATYAISEAYALTRIPSLKPAMEKAVDVIMKGQQTGGMWFYRYEKGNLVNNSVSGWQMQALKAAQMAGASNPGLKDAMERAIARLKTRQVEDGQFFYIQTGPGSRRDHGNTAVAVLCLQLLGHANSPEARKGQQALRDASIDWNSPPSWPMSVWYYITQAKFHQGGQQWTTWNEAFARAYTRNQNEDGSWSSPAKSGASIPFGYEHFFGPAFSTAMSTLTLTVYYRFLPTYQQIEIKEEEAPKTRDVVIEII
ncbi:MAG TPA: terpene cyclase/mutase family protein [Kiritimatiellia bacterium]|nr:terpene cyclase/mutase family protein [Kiritimatiellia bacterium]HMO98630.1 terpene cyclase/mutase family protein [Kiritimatiellia bacterium]HMP96342.1 terpene cyclase/mutase family protein [Kiritimatiellia bacterium]